MGRKPTGQAGEFARNVAAAVNQLRASKGLTNQQLFEAAGMSASFYYSKMRGETAFTLNDLERLAMPLGVHPVDLARSGAALGGTQLLDPTVRIDRQQLAQRVQELLTFPLASGASFTWDALANHSESLGVTFDHEDLDSLLDAKGAEPVPLRHLRLLTSLWEVPDKFLTDFNDSEALDTAMAHLEFRAALIATGATAAAARAVGDVSPAALRAITQSLRSIQL